MIDVEDILEMVHNNIILINDGKDVNDALRTFVCQSILRSIGAGNYSIEYAIYGDNAVDSILGIYTYYLKLFNIEYESDFLYDKALIDSQSLITIQIKNGGYISIFIYDSKCPKHILRQYRETDSSYQLIYPSGSEHHQLC